MKLGLNQVIRAVHRKDLPETVMHDEAGHINYHYLMSNGGSLKSGDIQSSMFNHLDTKICCPVMYFLSNPFKTDRKVKPWTDVLLPDEGLVYYNGDNKTPGQLPGKRFNSGNKKMETIWEMYNSHNKKDREKASPILVFEQAEVKGETKGYRAFRGYGIITNIDIRQEYEPKQKRVYSNYLFEVTLLQVPPDGFDFRWIYERRDENLPLEEINRKAPPAWKRWIKHGPSVDAGMRQRIAHYQICSPNDQVAELARSHREILDKIVEYYPSSTDKGRFEALASLVTQQYFGEHYTPGWITKHSGDMGVDFIGRLDIKNHLAACIEDPVVIDKILTHLREKETPDPAGLLPESRAPPSDLFG